MIRRPPRSPLSPYTTLFRSAAAKASGGRRQGLRRLRSKSERRRMPRQAVIVDAVRTPLGRRDGMLKSWHPIDLLGFTLKDLVARNKLDPARIDDVIAGCVGQVGEQAFNVGRNAVLAAGFPESVPGTTVDRQCGSSQQAIHFAAQGVIAGSYDIAIGCGVDSV